MGISYFIPFLGQKRWNKLRLKNEWMKCTQKTWFMVKKKMKMPLSISRATSIAKNVDFVPNRMDSGFGNWAEKGLITIHQMFDGDAVKSLKQLQDKFGLVSTDFYRYLQLRDYLMLHKDWSIVRQPPTSLELLLIRITEERKGTKIVSQIYSCLQSQAEDNTLDIKEKWELEMNVVIEDEEWETICERNHKITNSPI